MEGGGHYCLYEPLTYNPTGLIYHCPKKGLLYSSGQLYPRNRATATGDLLHPPTLTLLP
jgi:hypothetical protein